MADLLFYPWYRSNLYETATSVESGRLKATLTLSLTETTSGRSNSQPLDYRLIGPRDIAGVQPGVILHMAPAPLTRDAETTKLVHVDFREADLPWRYTPEVNPTPPNTGLRPWLALLVGTAEEIQINKDTLTAQDAVYAEHRLAESGQWAHVQKQGEDDPNPIARLISPRGLKDGAGLKPQTEYVAALVPAFNDDGIAMWDMDANRRPTALKVFYSWRFWTAEKGDFETLAAAIVPRPNLGLGRASLFNPRVLDAEDKPVVLETRGAISSLIAEPEGGEALSASRTDLDFLNNAIPDEPRPPDVPAREIIGLPGYGLPWLPDLEEEGWGKQLNEDPRYRGDAGLGLWTAIEAQEALLNAAVVQLGSAGAALQRIGNLAMGLNAARRLWDRRLPIGDARQLRLFGSTMRRMRTQSGTVLDTALNGSVLSSAYFSSAAQRVFRHGTARSRHTSGGHFRADDLLTAAHKPPLQPLQTPAGLPHVDSVANEQGLPVYGDLPGMRPLPPDLIDFLRQFEGRIMDNEVQSEVVEGWQNFDLDCNNDEVMTFLGQFSGQPATLEIFIAAVRRCSIFQAGLNRDSIQRAGESLQIPLTGMEVDDFIGFMVDIVLPQPPSPYTQPHLDQLVKIVQNAINPYNPNAPAIRRIANTIKGIDIPPDFSPPEVAISVDYATWMLLKEYDKEWLLPGVGQLQKDSIVAMETNPVFISAFMVGVNTQYINEMHWRNLPIDRYSTPLMMFWGAFNYETQQREPDIQPIQEWETIKPLGDLSHQWIKPGDVSGKRDVVMVFHTDLFRRYPSTVVYLTKRETDADLQAPPGLKIDDSNRDRSQRRDFGPIFQGSIEPDIVFFGFDVNPDELAQYNLVLDEPPSELRFRNSTNPVVNNGAEFGALTIDHHTRVVFDGAELARKGLTVESH